MADYVVNGARLVCDRGSAVTELSIPSARMHLGGKLAVNWQDCVPGVNVFSFGLCTSGTYLRSRKAKQGQEHPCVLDLMDHYFLTDERAMISDLAEVIVPLENCRHQIRDIISSAVNEMTAIQHQCNKKMDYPICDSITEQYGTMWKKTENIYAMGGNAGEITGAINQFYEAARQNCTYLRMGIEDASIGLRLDSVMEQLELLVSQGEILAGLPESKERQLVTTDSFLICKCGGIITFVNSGQ